MYLRYLLVFGSLLPCCSSNAQFVPLTAKVRDTNQTIVSGKSQRASSGKAFITGRPTAPP